MYVIMLQDYFVVHRFRKMSSSESLDLKSRFVQQIVEVMRGQGYNHCLDS